MDDGCPPSLSVACSLSLSPSLSVSLRLSGELVAIPSDEGLMVEAGAKSLIWEYEFSYSHNFHTPRVILVVFDNVWGRQLGMFGHI